MDSTGGTTQFEEQIQCNYNVVIIRDGRRAAGPGGEVSRFGRGVEACGSTRIGLPAHCALGTN